MNLFEGSITELERNIMDRLHKEMMNVKESAN